MTEEKEVCYAKLNNPKEIRRSLLGCSKEIIEELKRFEQFKEVRDEKKRLMEEFSKNIKEINILNKKLKSALPSTNIKVPEYRKREEIEDIKEEKPKATTALDKLENELKDIEDKIGRMG